MIKISGSEVTYSLDWLGITLFPETFHGGDKLNIAGMLSAICSALEIPNEWRALGKGGRGFADIRVHEAIEGVTVYTTPYAAGQSYLHLEIKGKGCEAIGHKRVERLDAYLTEEGVRWQVSRMDVAFDHGAFTPNDLYRCFLSGRTQTRIKSYDYLSNNEGNTFYCGNKQSFQLCCYDKRGFTRAEIRAYKYDAKLLGKLLFSSGFDTAAHTALYLFGSSITFCEADGSPLAGWVSLASLADNREDLADRGVRPVSRLPVHAKVDRLHDTFRKHLSALAILAAGLRYPSALVVQMLDELKIDSASQPEVDKIRRLVDSAD